MENVIKGGAKWTDPEFKPEISSLRQPNDKDLKTEGIVWKRASEIFQHPQVFIDGIHPNDIK